MHASCQAKWVRIQHRIEGIDVHLVDALHVRPKRHLRRVAAVAPALILGLAVWLLVLAKELAALIIVVIGSRGTQGLLQLRFVHDVGVSAILLFCSRVSE